MKTSAQRDLRGHAGNVFSFMIGFPPLHPTSCKTFLHVLHVRFPPRGVDEDMLDKDQILLQKEAEVRAHMQTALNALFMVLFLCEMIKKNN